MEGFVPRDNVTRPHSTPVKKSVTGQPQKLRYISRLIRSNRQKNKKVSTRLVVIPRDSVTQALSKKSDQEKSTDRQTNKQTEINFLLYKEILAIQKCFASRLVPIQTQLEVTKSASRALRKFLCVRLSRSVEIYFNLKTNGQS